MNESTKQTPAATTITDFTITTFLALTVALTMAQCRSAWLLRFADSGCVKPAFIMQSDDGVQLGLAYEGYLQTCSYSSHGEVAVIVRKIIDG